MTDASTEMWVIYEHPRDYPNGYVLRRWKCGRAAEPDAVAIFADDLLAARAQVPLGKYRLPRFPSDDSSKALPASEPVTTKANARPSAPFSSPVRNIRPL